MHGAPFDETLGNSPEVSRSVLDNASMMIVMMNMPRGLGINLFKIA